MCRAMQVQCWRCSKVAKLRRLDYIDWDLCPECFSLVQKYSRVVYIHGISIRIVDNTKLPVHPADFRYQTKEHPWFPHVDVEVGMRHITFRSMKAVKEWLEDLEEGKIKW